MSLLLDALKEAELRKREVPAAGVAAPAFETEGTLALADDVATRTADSSGTTTPRALSPALTVAPVPPVVPAAEPVRAPLRTATAAEMLLAARAARSGDRVAGTAPGGTGATPPPRPGSGAAIRHVLSRGAMPWLIAIAVLVALALGGLVVYDGFFNEPAPAFEPASVNVTMPVDGTPSTVAAIPQTEPAASADRKPAVSVPAARQRPPSGDSQPQARSAVASLLPQGDVPRDAGEASDPTPRAVAPTATALRISVSREPALLDAAWSALQSGELPHAEELYRRTLTAEPGQVDAQLGLAVIAQARGDDAAARRGFRAVLESVPEHPRAWAGLAELAGDGELDAIESRLRQLLAARSSAPLHFALGNLLARQQRWDDAQAEFFAAATLEPDAADYAFNVAVALERLGKPGAALPWYERGLALAARGRSARFDSAVVSARISQLRGALP